MKIALVNLSKLQKFRTLKTFKKDFSFLLDNEIEFVDYCLDSDRPQDLLRGFHQALKNPEVDLVWFVRGGEKMSRFLDKIDWDLVKRANKQYIGFSDPTSFFFMAGKLGQTCYYGTNVFRIYERMNSKEFSNQDRKKLTAFFTKRELVPYQQENLFKECPDLSREKIIGGHLVINTMMLQRMKIDLSKYFLLFEYHLTTGDTVGELEFFIDWLKLAIKDNLPKGFVLGYSQVYDSNGRRLKQSVVNKIIVDNLKDLNRPITYINHIKQPIKLSF